MIPNIRFKKKRLEIYISSIFNAFICDYILEVITWAIWQLDVAVASRDRCTVKFILDYVTIIH